MSHNTEKKGGGGGEEGPTRDTENNARRPLPTQVASRPPQAAGEPGPVSATDATVLAQQDEANTRGTAGTRSHRVR